ncbi:MAG: flagellar biosynthesis protein FlhA [Phycisphaerales bacterium]|nr:flagellar biosynthesis protein FlhA [Planctomycetota bacterium]MCH8508521.1 flagellar biosynthesis protein FlhA [Phycisphaerales bacterium]
MSEAAPTSPITLITERIDRYRGLLVPVGFIMLMTVILVPLPPAMLDILISLNISLAVIILLTTIYMKKALEFSVFPSLLLATTLFRLVLNIASTRLILTADAASPEEAMGVAGKVISAFGTFVAGNSLFVGVVIFLILMIVQFMVVTKGAGRIAEVAARFTLDALPGKQMAIDAELTNGMLTEEQARERREEISREADFYGAMDGASKFVKGDAIAGIIITMINIAGGFAIGVIERGWPAGQVAEVFTTLTIGDGLTSQIPSFIISIAAALIVTRSGSKADLGNELTGQLSSQPTGLYITATFVGVLALTPLPTAPLMATGVGLAIIAWGINRARRGKADDAAELEAAERQAVKPEAPPVEDLLKVDVLELEVGYALVPLIDSVQGGDLLERISAVRRQLAVELGMVMPPVRIRDNMQLPPGDYRVKIRGNPVASGSVETGKLMAMDSGLTTGPIEGIPTKEPAFGLDAWWIDKSQRARAEARNYTVVDPTSVLATHITEIVKTHADELLTRQEVNNLLEGLKEKAGKLVEDTIPGVVKLGDLQKILQSLLRERVPVRDMETILETLADWGARTQDADVLVEYVRNALRRTICAQYAAPDDDGKLTLACVTLDPALEDQIDAYIERGGHGTSLHMPAKIARQIAEKVTAQLQSVAARGRLPVVIASPAVRATVYQIVGPHVPGLAVLGYNEVIPGIEVESVGLVGALADKQPAAVA